MSDRCTLDVTLVLAMTSALLPMPGSAELNTSGDNARLAWQHLPSEATVTRKTSGATVAACNSHVASLVACLKRFSRTTRCRRIMARRHHTAGAA
jgi:hypothetical protein